MESSQPRWLKHDSFSIQKLQSVSKIPHGPILEQKMPQNYQQIIQKFKKNIHCLLPNVTILLITKIKSNNSIKAPMGIDGLLNLLRPVTQKQHISTFKGKTLAVDAMPWIYKGCYSCAMELNQNVESIDFLYYILEMLDMLSYYSIKPIFVFDGRAIHAKNDTLEKRKKSKEENKQKGLEYLKNNQLEEARKYLSRCIIIDERIIAMTINCLVTKNIEFYVAPYEADCQIAKLKRMGMVDAVISEDSDLIIFGVNVILKLNQNGECDYVDLMKWRPKDVTDVFLKYFLAFDELSRIDAAILAGSDYNQSVKGIGIKRAIKLLTTQVTMKNVINKLKYKKTYMARIPEDYEQTVQRSKLIFNLSTVYNPFEKRLQFLRPELVNDLKPEQMTQQELLDIVGRHYEYDEQVVYGRVSSKTLEKRQLKILNFPQIFRINKENMLAHETMIKRKKFQDEQARKNAHQQSISENTNPNIGDQVIFEQLNEFKRRAGGVQQTEQDIERRKQQRKNRINQLHSLMSSFVDIFGESDEEDPFENSDEESNEDRANKAQTIQTKQFHNPTINQNNPNNDTKHKTEPVIIQHEDNKYVSEQESVSQQLGFLNPVVKKDNKPNQNPKANSNIKQAPTPDESSFVNPFLRKDIKPSQTNNSNVKQQTLGSFLKK